MSDQTYLGVVVMDICRYSCPSKGNSGGNEYIYIYNPKSIENGKKTEFIFKEH